MQRCLRVASLLTCLAPFTHSFTPARTRSRVSCPNTQNILGAGLSGGEVELLGWVGAFSLTHIGLSAVREPVIKVFGKGAAAVGLVGNQKWALPPVWLGDKKNVDEQSGKELVFGDEATAGRQLFRVAYSVVAGVTLGFSFASFQAVQLASPVLDWTVPLNSSPPARALLFACAVGSLAVSLASLKNPSPLSLVPGFEPDEDAPLGLRRDDSLKLRAYGLTRVTRHPLILPVVPWGFANALLTGGRAADVILFLGLGLYALAGCYAQDLRASAAAEVGTVFAKGDLTSFYADTSFVPFAAILDGRQPSPFSPPSSHSPPSHFISSAAVPSKTKNPAIEAPTSRDLDVRRGDDGGWLLREVPWAFLAGGLVVGTAVETATLMLVSPAVYWT